MRSDDDEMSRRKFGRTVTKRAKPFLQETIDDAFGVQDLDTFESYSAEELADGFLKCSIIDYLHGSGSLSSAWKAVYLIKDIQEKKAKTTGIQKGKIEKEEEEGEDNT
jgi:hypothetical protein